MAATNDVRAEINTLSLKIAILNEQIASMQATVTDLENKKLRLEISVSQVDYDKETRVPENEIITTHGSKFSYGAPPEYNELIYALEGMEIVARNRNIAITNRANEMIEMLETQIKSNENSTSRKATPKIEWGFDKLLEKDNLLVGKLKQLVGNDSSKRLRVENSEGKLAKGWEMQLNYLRNTRNGLAFAGSRLGQYLATHQLELYNMLVEVLRGAREIHGAFKKYQYLKKSMPLVLENNEYVKNVTENSNKKFAKLLGAQ